MPDDFASNLSLLCSYHPSIAEVCRRLNFNRQQFNKYLNGQSRPSRSNMRRICDFFGVTEAEILLHPSQFHNLVSVRARPVEEVALSRPMEHLNALYRECQSLDRYVGHYYRYFFSFSSAGMITKSLGVIYEVDQKYYWKNIELIREPEGGRTRAINKYEGVVFFLANRIYIIEYEVMRTNSLTQIILYPSYHHRIGQLMGIQTGGPTRRGRRPAASKVMLEYLGRNVDTRKALREIGILNPEDEGIPKGVADQISNRIPGGAFVLEVEEPGEIA